MRAVSSSLLKRLTPSRNDGSTNLLKNLTPSDSTQPAAQSLRKWNFISVANGNPYQHSRSHSTLAITHSPLPCDSLLAPSRRTALSLVNPRNSFLLSPGANPNHSGRSLGRYGHVMSSMDRDRPYTVVVEGNIGSGKTTFLQHFASANHPSAPVETFQEPVSKWRDVKGHNALGLMYEDPKRWSLTFQTYVQLTMVDLHTRKTTHPRAVKMMERSIYSAKYCFVENLKISETMPEIEYVVLTEWFDWLISRQSCDVDLIVYLRTSPEVVYERIRRRCRNEEKAIPLEYLRSLHRLHERWLVPGDGVGEEERGVEESRRLTRFPLPAPVMVLDGNITSEEMVRIVEQRKGEILGGSSGGGRIGESLGRSPPRNGLHKVRNLCAEEEEEGEEADSQNEPRSISQKRSDTDEGNDRNRKTKILKALN